MYCFIGLEPTIIQNKAHGKNSGGKIGPISHWDKFAIPQKVRFYSVQFSPLPSDLLLENLCPKPMHSFKYQLVIFKHKSFKNPIASFRISKQYEDTSC